MVQTSSGTKSNEDQQPMTAQYNANAAQASAAHN